MYLYTHCSLNLNFLSYVYNAYQNHYKIPTAKQSTSFPLLSFHNDGLLPFNEFQSVFTDTGNNIIKQLNSIKQDSERSLYLEELEITLEKKENYSKLFKSNKYGKKNLSEIWKSFLNWWHSPFLGHHILDRISGVGVNRVGEKFFEKLVQMNIQGTSIFVIILFDSIPDTFDFTGEYFIIKTLREIDFDYMSNSEQDIKVNDTVNELINLL